MPLTTSTPRPTLRQSRQLSMTGRKSNSHSCSASVTDGESIRVYCRVRPFSGPEKKKKSAAAEALSYPVSANAASELIVCKPPPPPPPPQSIASSSAGGAAAANPQQQKQELQFEFTKVLRADSTQEDVYNTVAAPIVSAVMEGYNGTVLAYGQTGSGKTHTMFGKPPPAPGGRALAKKHRKRRGTDSLTATRTQKLLSPLSGTLGDRSGDGSPVAGLGKPRAGISFAPFHQNGGEEEEEEDGGQRGGRGGGSSGTADVVEPSWVDEEEDEDEDRDGDDDDKLSDAAAAATDGGQEEEGGGAVAGGDGIVPRAVRDVFDFIAKADPNLLFEVRVFLVEVYMEQVLDLLCAVDGGNEKTGPPRRLRVREDVSGGSFYVESCRMPFVSSAEEALALVRDGLKQRKTHSTGMNECSSRSHCILSIAVKSTHAETKASTVGKLFLVDLAGSEKVGKTKSFGVRLEEAKQINKSLTSLGMVIVALSEGAAHIPYRDSVVTMILKDSLGGNSRTALIVCCSPSMHNAAETVSTLRFGIRAKNVRNKAVVNRQLSVEFLTRMLAAAERELARLQRKLKRQRRQGPGTDGRSRSGRSKGAPREEDEAEEEEGDGEEEEDEERSGEGVGGGASLHAFPLPGADADGKNGISSSFTSELTHTANAAVGGGGATGRDDFSLLAEGSIASVDGVDERLQETAALQLHLQQVEADLAEAQDALRDAREAASLLKEQREAHLTRITHAEEEIAVWESEYAALQLALGKERQKKRDLTARIHSQRAEIVLLIRQLESHVEPIRRARALLEASDASLFGPGVSPHRQRTLMALSGGRSAVRGLYGCPSPFSPFPAPPNASQQQQLRDVHSHAGQRTGEEEAGDDRVHLDQGESTGYRVGDRGGATAGRDDESPVAVPPLDGVGGGGDGGRLTDGTALLGAGSSFGATSTSPLRFQRPTAVGTWAAAEAPPAPELLVESQRLLDAVARERARERANGSGSGSGSRPRQGSEEPPSAPASTAADSQPHHPERQSFPPSLSASPFSHLQSQHRSGHHTMDRGADGIAGATAAGAGLTMAAATRIVDLESELAEAEGRCATAQKSSSLLCLELQQAEKTLRKRQERIDSLNLCLQHAENENAELHRVLHSERATTKKMLQRARSDVAYWRRKYDELSTEQGQSQAPFSLYGGTIAKPLRGGGGGGGAFAASQQ